MNRNIVGRTRHPADRWLAVDGEARSDTGAYILMAASTGETVTNPDGLSTLDCLTFLARLRHTYRDRRMVGFGVCGYDVNMMLRPQLAPRRMRVLFQTGRTNSDGLGDGECWRFQWIPAKVFVASPGPGRGFKLQDVFGIFGCSFVAALEAWDVAAPDTISRMKGERDSFSIGQLEEIRWYCLQECGLLAELMGRVETATTRAGWKPRAWHGAGALAASMLTTNHVRREIRHDTDWTAPVRDAVMTAYYGGRVEAYGCGHAGPCRSFDIRSAYPAAIIDLPSLAGASWRRRRRWSSDAPDWTVWRVSWTVDAADNVMPFPLRHKRQVHYLANGSGWYWQPEVAAARRVYGDQVTVHDGYQLVPASSAEPFRFVAAEYDRRAAFKAAGDPAEKVVKLAINSVYGKLAQGVAFNGQTPAFQSFVLAGLVTSRTRAAMLAAAYPYRDRVALVATDGLVLRGVEDAPLVPVGAGLGAWEASTYSAAFIVQPGLYQATTSAGVTTRTRGWYPREIDWPELISRYDADGVYAVYRRPGGRRFVAAGRCSQLNDWSRWATWQPSERSLSFYPTRKYVVDDTSRGWTAFRPGRSEPGCELVSMRYVPRGGDLAADLAGVSETYLDGREQPLDRFDL